MIKKTSNGYPALHHLMRVNKKYSKGEKLMGGFNLLIVTAFNSIHVMEINITQH